MKLKPKQHIKKKLNECKAKTLLYQTNLYLLKPWKTTRTTFSKAQFIKSLFLQKPL